MVVRLLLLPLTLKQFKSMQALQRLPPEIKELQEKYKDDKQRLKQEMMKFYQENKVNPLASCLPLLAQLPVFIALFYMLRRTCGSTSARTSPRRRRRGRRLDSPGHPGSAEFLVHPRPDRQGDGRRCWSC